MFKQIAKVAQGPNLNPLLLHYITMDQSAAKHETILSVSLLNHVLISEIAAGNFFDFNIQNITLVVVLFLQTLTQFRLHLQSLSISTNAFTHTLQNYNFIT